MMIVERKMNLGVSSIMPILSDDRRGDMVAPKRGKEVIMMNEKS